MTEEDSSIAQSPAGGVENRRKVSKLTIVFAIVLTVINMLLGFLKSGEYSSLQEMNAQITSAILFPFIIGLIVVGLFQLGKQHRNQDSRWKIYCLTLIFAAFVRLTQTAT